jgi:hypothetical protein
MNVYIFRKEAEESKSRLLIFSNYEADLQNAALAGGRGIYTPTYKYIFRILKVLGSIASMEPW